MSCILCAFVDGYTEYKWLYVATCTYCSNIVVNNFNKMHKSQSLFFLRTALHVSGVTIAHLQEHKTTVSAASCNRYTVIDRVKFY